MSHDADILYRAAQADRRATENRERIRENFEVFCEARDAAALIAEAEAILRDAA